MKERTLSLIAALDSKRGIGKNNQLLFKIPEDLKRFKNLTLGHPIIIGRKTFESIGRVLLGRDNIIITRNRDYIVEGAKMVHSLDEAIELAKHVILKGVKRPIESNEEIFIIGGGEIYSQAIKFADKLYLTLVEGDFKADTFFPDYSDFKRVVFEKDGDFKGLRYKFLDLER